MGENKQYVGYDYKTIIVNRKFESAWVDDYDNFGWELIKSQPAVAGPVWGPLRIMLAPLAILPGSFFKNLVMGHERPDQTELHFKRDKKIKNKNELNRLQFSMENEMSSVERMWAGKTFGASVAAYVTGLIGTVFMALAMFCYLESRTALWIEFGTSGFIGWILSAIVYLLIKKKRETRVITEMEEKFDAIDQICMQAYELIAE